MAEQSRGLNNEAQSLGQNYSNSHELPSTSNISKTEEPSALRTLIVWNILKVLDKNPNMDIKGALEEARVRLDRELDVTAAISDSPEQRHIACTVLAWQQLGHNDTDSLYRFVDGKIKEQECASLLSDKSVRDKVSSHSCSQGSNTSKRSKGMWSMSFDSNPMGPVVKLPLEPKIVMQMESKPCMWKAKWQKAQNANATRTRIEAACRLDSPCTSRLAELDKTNEQLQTRSCALAKREAERAALLQRAEAAWRDLELGYQRRLTLAEEKEDELTKQVNKVVEERNQCKNACNCLVPLLKERAEKAEKDRTELTTADKGLCERAIRRMTLNKEFARSDAALAECQFKAAQVDRDQQFKEEQARRTLANYQSELESSQAITLDAEYTMRAELIGLKNQVADVSIKLLEEDSANATIKQELERLQEEKTEMMKDLESCREMCDDRMQERTEELNKKTEQFAKLKEQVTECRCKSPVDKNVEVKRTVSFAALCHCRPEERSLESCSCTSIRAKLLSDVLADLFGGLQTEMGGVGSQMPCQMLKCLEDKHKWDRSSTVKTNLENYFSKLLMGELDIAIATSIEKYHAKWVGSTCADAISKNRPDKSPVSKEGRHCAIECRALELAGDLAEQLFQERADQFKNSDTPWKYKPRSPQKSQYGKEGAELYRASNRVVTASSSRPKPGSPSRPQSPSTPAYWWQAMQDVTQLKAQIENIHKESLKKEDLELMEKKITQIIQRSGSSNADVPVETCTNSTVVNKTLVKKEKKHNRCTNCDESYLQKPHKNSITNQINQKPMVINSNGYENTLKPYKKRTQTYSINMCICSQRDIYKINKQDRISNNQINEESKSGLQKEKTSKILKPQMSTMASIVKQTKPVNSNLRTKGTRNRNSQEQHCCSGVCFHKVPSNTSIDKLLETLIKWKSGHNTFDNESTKYCDCVPEAEIAKLKEGQQIGIKMGLSHDQDIDSIKPNKPYSDNLQQDRVRHTRVGSVTSGKKNSQSNNWTETRQRNRSRSASLDKSLSKSFNKEKSSKISSYKNTTLGIGSPIFNKVNKNRSKNMIPPTESEYMGAINLDKSNEDFCKCTSNTFKSPNGTFQCLRCPCKKLAPKTIKSELSNRDKIPVVAESNKQVKGDIKNVRSSVKNSSHDAGDTKNSHSSLVLKKINEDKNIKEQDSCDCYDIRFLGVTLTDISSNTQINRNKYNISEEHENTTVKKYDTDITNLQNEDKMWSEKNPILKGDQKYKESRQKIKDTESCKKSPSCEWKLNNNRELNVSRVSIEEEKQELNFNNKECLDNDFQNQQTNEEIGLDLQSFKENQKEESCVCCKNKYVDSSKDLEENTFHLLEDHLKNKLQDFKDTSCNEECIPPGEADIFFTTILDKIKKVIAESTNKITCKCPKTERTSQGSWNRAYGLLQEYLKIKIKRVQCSCVLAQENNDTVFPEVLEKVCNLIDYDFKRLQDVCICKQSVEGRNDKFDFKEEIPNPDSSFSQKLTLKKENNLSQLPPEVTTKYHNSFEPITKNIKTFENKQDLEPLDKSASIGGFNFDDQLLGNQTINKIESDEGRRMPMQNLPYVGYNSECICNEFECTLDSHLENDSKKVKNVYKNPEQEKKNTHVRATIFNTQDIQNSKPQQVREISQKTEPFVTNTDSVYDDNCPCMQNEEDKKSLTKPIEKSQIKKGDNNVLIKAENKEYCPCVHDDEELNTFSCALQENVLNSSRKPYVGFTVECSCNDAFGPCICSKAAFKDNRAAMDIIIKDTLPDDKLYDKQYNYIMKKNPDNNINTYIMSDLSENLFLNNVLQPITIRNKDCQTKDVFLNEDINLKVSRDDFEMAHTTTNTDDNRSWITDYSNTESPTDLCGCLQMPTQGKHTDKHTRSNYTDNYDKYYKTEKQNTESKHDHCYCDMVPLCHVKMLVENIENNLAAAKCTCDTMLPIVCPIHSLDGDA